jgi:adenylate kinase
VSRLVGSEMCIRDRANNDPSNAPKYRAISGQGSVEEIKDRALKALSS